MDDSVFGWPFFEAHHRDEGVAVRAWCDGALPSLLDAREDLASVCDTTKRLVVELGRAGLLRACVPAAYGGLHDGVEVRSLCIAREMLAQGASLADFAFAMQGLGSVPITLFGSRAQKEQYLPGIAAGTRIGAFALSEPEAGSDVAAIAATARRVQDGWRLDGTKTWISNAGIATQYIVFARTGEAPGSKGLSAFIVDASSAGLTTQPIEVLAPHPLGSVDLSDCRVPHEALLGEAGQGFRIAMATLDVFRSSVGAAALGFARRALSEAAAHAQGRSMFGSRLADMQLTQVKLGEMALSIDAAALLVYRAAWSKDVLGARVTREASMAKLFATESAQQVIDAAVQMFGGLGIARGSTVERLYRDIRALRIYEGASEVLKLVIGASVLKSIPSHSPQSSRA